MTTLDIIDLAIERAEQRIGMLELLIADSEAAGLDTSSARRLLKRCLASQDQRIQRRARLNR